MKMKKNWANPEMTALEIKETAGGSTLSMNQDGNIWWSEEKGSFQQPIGEDNTDS